MQQLQRWQPRVSFGIVLILLVYWLGSYALYGNTLRGDVVLPVLSVVLVGSVSVRWFVGRGHVPRQPLVYGLGLLSLVLLLDDVTAVTQVMAIIGVLVGCSQMLLPRWWVRLLAMSSLAGAVVSLVGAVLGLSASAWQVAIVGMLVGLPVITGYVLSGRGVIRWALAYGLLVVGLCVTQDWGIILLVGMYTLYLLARVGLTGDWRQLVVIIGAPLLGLVAIVLVVRFVPAADARGRVDELSLRDRAGRVLPTMIDTFGDSTAPSVEDTLVMQADWESTTQMVYPVSLPDDETVWLQFEVMQPAEQWATANTVVHYNAEVVFRQGFREPIFAYRHAPRDTRRDQAPQRFSVNLSRYEGRTFFIVIGAHSERTPTAEAQWTRLRLVSGLDTPLSEVDAEAVWEQTDSDIPALYGVLLNPAVAVQRRFANWRYTLDSGDPQLTVLPRLNDGVGMLARSGGAGLMGYALVWLLLLWQLWRGFGSSVNRAYGTGVVLLLVYGMWSGVLITPPVFAVVAGLAALWRVPPAR